MNLQKCKGREALDKGEIKFRLRRARPLARYAVGHSHYYDSSR